MTIKDVRKAQKLSQGELAAALGISVSSERSYEYGVRKPNAKVIEQIKALYGVDLNDEAAAPAATVEEKAAEAAPAAVEEAPVKPKRGRKKKETTVEAAPAPAVEETIETVEEAPAKPKRGRKKKDAAEGSPIPAVEDALAKPKRGRKRKEAVAEPASEPAPTPVDESLLKMQNDAEAAVHALFTPATAIIIQSPMGGEIDVTEILAKVGPVDKVYVRVDQNAAYWVKGDESGAVNLW